jgi:hypothetical protein
MKQFLHKSAAVIMTFVVLISTLSLTVDMHYCGETLVDVAFFSEAETCGMEQKKSTTSKCSVMKKNCCSDEQIVIEGQDELQITFDKITFKQQLFVATFFQSYVNLFKGLEISVIPFSDYPPPFLVKDIQKLDEVYLI